MGINPLRTRCTRGPRPDDSAMYARDTANSRPSVGATMDRLLASPSPSCKGGCVSASSCQRPQRSADLKSLGLYSFTNSRAGWRCSSLSLWNPPIIFRVLCSVDTQPPAFWTGLHKSWPCFKCILRETCPCVAQLESGMEHFPRRHHTWEAREDLHSRRVGCEKDLLPCLCALTTATYIPMAETDIYHCQTPVRPADISDMQRQHWQA